MVIPNGRIDRLRVEYMQCFEREFTQEMCLFKRTKCGCFMFIFTELKMYISFLQHRYLIFHFDNAIITLKLRWNVFIGYTPEPIVEPFEANDSITARLWKRVGYCVAGRWRSVSILCEKYIKGMLSKVKPIYRANWMRFNQHNND